MLQKKDLFSSDLSTNSVDIDNPVPREGGLEKVSGPIKKTCLWRYAVPTSSGLLVTSWSGTGSGHYSFDAMALWWHGNHWMGALFISSPACGRKVHPSTAQPSGSKIASSNGLAWDGHRSSLRGFQKNHHLALSFLRRCLFLCVLASKKMKKWADKKRRPREFQVGDLVLVKMYNHARLGGRHRALIRRYEGPFPILKKVGAQAYKVELPPKIKYHPVFHVSLLKPYHGDQVDPSRGISHRAPMGIQVQHDKEVEEVLADRVVRHSNQPPTVGTCDRSTVLMKCSSSTAKRKGQLTEGTAIDLVLLAIDQLYRLVLRIDSNIECEKAQSNWHCLTCIWVRPIIDSLWTSERELEGQSCSLQSSSPFHFERVQE